MAFLMTDLGKRGDIHLIMELGLSLIFVGKKTLEVAAAIAACQYSIGVIFEVAICNILNMEPGNTLIRSAKRKNSIRLKKAEKASSEVGRSIGRS